MSSSWPSPLVGLEGDDTGGDSVSSDFVLFQEAVRAVRNIRAEHQVPLGKKIPGAVLVIDSDRVRSRLKSEEKSLQFLCKLDTITWVGSQQSMDPEQYVESVVGDGFCVYLPVAGLVDAEQEINRLSRQVSAVQCRGGR